MARQGALRYLWHTHRLALTGFALALALALFFAVRFALFTIYWADPAHRDTQIEPWMTPGYVAHSYRLPPDLLFEALHLPHGSRATIHEIAQQTGRSDAALIEALRTAIAQARQ